MDTFLNLIAATALFVIYTVGTVISTIIVTIFIIYSPYRIIGVLYLIWIWVDRETPARGGRSIEWVRSWTWWKRIMAYFDHKVVADEVGELDPKRNYLFCCFPHAVLPFGSSSRMIAIDSDSRKLFPHHKVSICALDILFYPPITRDLILSMGMVSTSARSMKYILEKETGGNMLCIFPGGAAEAIVAKPNSYEFVLKNRKGFVKLALETGSPLIPVIIFNEIGAYQQVTSPVVVFFQEMTKRFLKFTMVLLHGRYLICPHKVPIIMIVGKPIEVKKNKEPMKEEIDEVHQAFVEKVQELFEKHKHKYVENHENIFLRII